MKSKKIKRRRESSGFTSILALALLHPTKYTFGNQFSRTAAGHVQPIGRMIFALISDRMWEKLPSNPFVTYQNPVF